MGGKRMAVGYEGAPGRKWWTGWKESRDQNEIQNHNQK
jgi:hypothetical protein